MGYRIHEHKKPEPRRTAVDTATPLKLYIHNGTVSNFAFPCWYQEIYPPIPAKLHDRHLHDHQGWPSWQHPDHICQLWIPEKGHCIHGMQECHPHCRHYIDFKKIKPIHLLSDYEGYDNAYVRWVDEPEGIECSAYIDPVEDWVVRLHVDCQDENATYDPQVYKGTLFIGASPKSSDQQINSSKGLIKGSEESYNNNNNYRTDIVALFELIVLPSATSFEIQ